MGKEGGVCQRPGSSKKYLKHWQTEGDMLDFLKFDFAILEIQKPTRRIKTGVTTIQCKEHRLGAQKIGFLCVYCDNLS